MPDCQTLKPGKVIQKVGEVRLSLSTSVAAHTTKAIYQEENKDKDKDKDKDKTIQK